VTFFDLFDAVEAFTHVAKTTLVACFTIAMPRAFEFVRHVIFKLIPPDLFWIARQQICDKVFEVVPAFFKIRLFTI
jgi:hypothetical protein